VYDGVSNKSLDLDVRVYDEERMTRNGRGRSRTTGRFVQTILPEPIWREADRLAKKDGRSMASWLRQLVTSKVGRRPLAKGRR